MKTKTLALTIVFAAVTIALNPAFTNIAFAAPYAIFLFYQIWEIPIVAAFKLSGLESGFIISLLNTLVLLAVFPGASPTGPFYNLAAVLSMLLGIYLASRFIAGKRQNLDTDVKFGIERIAFSTAVGIVFRVGLMSIVNYVFLRFPPPFGYSYTDAAVLSFLPVVGFFNATLALYTIPAGLIIANTIKSNLRLET